MTPIPPVSDLLITVKSHEAQRALVAEMRGDAAAAERHLLAAAHLELVLAEDYLAAGGPELAWRSRISAASCFWRAGQQDQGRRLLETLRREQPARASEIDEILGDLART
jgi:hypothetical protein